MNHTLDHFIEFLDDPDNYDDAQYRLFFDEWIVYLKEHEGTLDFLGEEWRERRERLHEQYKKRLYITPEIKNKLEKINLQLENVKTLNDQEAVALFQRNIDFLSENQCRFRFGEEHIIFFRTQLEMFEKSIEKHRIAEEKLRQSKIALDDSMQQLEEGMIKEYERTGKMPIVNFDASIKKKFDN